MKIPTKDLQGQKLAPIRHNEKGEEILDDFQPQPPLGYHKPESLWDQIARAVRYQKLEDAQLHETDEEADDFDVEDEFFPMSAHENDGMPTIKELKKQAKEINEKIQKRIREKTIKEHEAKKAAAKPESRPEAKVSEPTE